VTPAPDTATEISARTTAGVIEALSSILWFEISIKAYISVTSKRRLRTVCGTYSSKRPAAINDDRSAAWRRSPQV
jgi:hypothetical protein